jgi:hypothetical protein
MLSRTIYLGKLIGLYCLFVALAMIFHKHTTVETMTALVHDAPVLFLASLLAMAAGLAQAATRRPADRSELMKSTASTQFRSAFNIYVVTSEKPLRPANPHGSIQSPLQRLHKLSR